MYKLDNILNTLRDNGSTRSKLFLCYLHGLTSFCLPDNFTKHTGTEQALLILQGAVAKSFQRLTEKDLSLLHNIAAIAPTRGCGTASPGMLTVTWDSKLHMLAQHPSFHSSVMDLVQQNDYAQLYYPDESGKPLEIIAPDQKLLPRDAIRTSAFRVSEFGAEHWTSEHDVLYNSRDNDEDSDPDQASRCATLSSMSIIAKQFCVTEEPERRLGAWHHTF